MPKRGPSENYVLRELEIKALLNVCKPMQDRVIILLPLYCGLREGEAVHLDNRWIDSGGDLRIPSDMLCGCRECAKRIKNHGYWVPKTTAGVRTIGVPRVVADSLGPFLAEHPKGLEMSRFSYYRHVKRLMTAAKIRIPGLGGDTAYPHVLRATCATMLAAGGMNAPQLCYTMGWKDLQQGAYYVHRATMQDTAPASVKKIFGG